MDTNGGKEKRMSKKNMDRRCTSSHDNKKFRTRSVEKQEGMAFGFWKTATAVIKPDGWVDGWIDGWMGGWVDGWIDGWMGGWLDG
jgi:hypothetical protein